MYVNRCLKSHKILKNRIEHRLGVPPHYLLDDLNNRPKQILKDRGIFFSGLVCFTPFTPIKIFLKLLCLIHLIINYLYHTPYFRHFHYFFLRDPPPPKKNIRFCRNMSLYYSGNINQYKLVVEFWKLCSTVKQKIFFLRLVLKRDTKVIFTVSMSLSVITLWVKFVMYSSTHYINDAYDALLEVIGISIIIRN